MKKDRPLILISNDDGFRAKGINCLIEMLRPIGNLIVCAPEGARSGYSCAFSATSPLFLKKVREEEGLQVWSCSGTPPVGLIGEDARQGEDDEEGDVFGWQFHDGFRLLLTDAKVGLILIGNAI